MEMSAFDDLTKPLRGNFMSGKFRFRARGRPGALCFGSNAHVCVINYFNRLVMTCDILFTFVGDHY